MGVVGVLQIDLIGVAGRADNGIFVQGSGVLHGDDRAVAGAQDFHVIAGNSQSGDSIRIDSRSNRKRAGYIGTVEGYFGVIVIGQPFGQGIVEYHLISSVGRDVVRQGGRQLERYLVADVVVSGVLPSVVCNTAVLRVVDILDLLYHFGRTGILGVHIHILHNFQNIAGVGIMITSQRTFLILDQIITGSQTGDDVLAVCDSIGGTGNSAQITRHFLCKGRGVICGFDSLRLCSRIAQRGLSRLGHAGAPFDVGQGAIIQITGKDLVGLISMALGGVVDRNRISLVRKCRDGQGQGHDQRQEQAGDFFAVFHRKSSSRL